jgi:hypothetical protein
MVIEQFTVSTCDVDDHSRSPNWADIGQAAEARDLQTIVTLELLCEELFTKPEHYFVVEL